MAKQKTKKSVLKRFRVTKRGKVLHRSSFARHLRRKKSASQSRRHKQFKFLFGRRARKIKRLLGLS